MGPRPAAAKGGTGSKGAAASAKESSGDAAIALTILIPTYRRPTELAALLASIAKQKVADDLLAGGTVEVLVFDDDDERGAEKVVEEARKAMSASWELVYRAPGHRGPSGIRNAAFAESRGRVILILNDDVTLEPDHLATHLAYHAANPGLAARGMTRWAPAEADDLFMDWLMRQSFFYYLIGEREAIGYEYWHTCDLSIDRRWVCDGAADAPAGAPFRFDEEFPYAGYEDTEWGWRLEEAGCTLAFIPDALSYHYHHYTPDSLAARGRRNGICGAILYDKVPALAGRAILDALDALGEGVNPDATNHGQREMRRRGWLAFAAWPWRAIRGGRRGEARPSLLQRLGEAIAEAGKSLDIADAHAPATDDAYSVSTAEWSETYQRAYLAGFVEEFERRRGHGFDAFALREEAAIRLAQLETISTESAPAVDLEGPTL